MSDTADDLKALPIIGRVFLFIRGAQRSIWGFTVLWIDIQVLSGEWIVVNGTTLESMLYLMNFLVLGFLFGERAVKNILPALTALIQAKK